MTKQTEANHLIMGMTKTTLSILVISGLGGLLYGFDIGIISGALVFMQESLGINSSQASLIVSAVLGGGAIAILFAGPFADRFGRRLSMNLSAIIFIIGTLVLMLATSFTMVMAGRLIQGVGVGIITIVVPLYLAEIVPSDLRGRGVALFQLALTFGILLGYLVNYFLKSTGDWRLMFATGLVPSIIFLLGGLFLLPRSPRWLYVNDEEDEARDVIGQTQSNENIDKAITEIEAVVEKEREQDSGSWGMLFQSGYRKAFFVALAVGILTQLTGINVLLQFNATILADAGMQTAILGSVGVGLINFVVTIIAMSLVDRVGRRPLLITGTAGVTISLVFIGIVQAFWPTSLFTGYATLGGFMVFTVFYAVGPGVVVWLAVSEILPQAIRAKGMSVALFANSLTSALLGAAFMDIVDLIDYSGIFLLLGFFTFLYLLIAIFPLPETKGRSLEEIENELLGE